MKTLETDRTILSEMTENDAEFILSLLNQPSFIKNIGDRNVRTIEQAREYIETRFTSSYRQFGFGFWKIELKENCMPIGICGFVKRDYLTDADVGFALLPQYEKCGFGFETAGAVMRYGRETLNFKRVLAITSQNNEASGKLLEKLGLKFEKLIEVPHDPEKLKLFAADLE